MNCPNYYDGFCKLDGAECIGCDDYDETEDGQ